VAPSKVCGRARTSPVREIVHASTRGSLGGQPSPAGPNPAADASRPIPQFDIVAAVHQGSGLFDGFLVTTASDDIRRIYNMSLPIDWIDAIIGHVGFPSSAMMGKMAEAPSLV
jgi:hypothetical protein